MIRANRFARIASRIARATEALKVSVKLLEANLNITFLRAFPGKSLSFPRMLGSEESFRITRYFLKGLY